MQYAVLGGGGSFGLATSRFLLAQPGTTRVIGIGRNPPKPPCFTLETGKNDPRYEYRAYHLTYELDLLMDYLAEEGPDVIINFAAQGEGATSFKHSWRYFETNAMGMTRLVEEIIKYKLDLQRFIHIGTSELYGSTDKPADERSPIRPTSPYAASKAAFDLYLLALYEKTRFPMNIIRPSNCYGPGQQLHRVIPRAVLCGLSGEKLPLQGGGKAMKSYMHTNDLCTAIWRVLKKGEPGQVYNAGPLDAVTIRWVVGMVAERLGMSLEELSVVTEDRAHQDNRYWLDSSKLRELGWQTKVKWEIGLESVVEWMRAYQTELTAMSKEFVMRG